MNIPYRVPHRLSSCYAGLTSRLQHLFTSSGVGVRVSAIDFLRGVTQLFDNPGMGLAISRVRVYLAKRAHYLMEVLFLANCEEQQRLAFWFSPIDRYI